MPSMICKTTAATAPTIIHARADFHERANATKPTTDETMKNVSAIMSHARGETTFKCSSIAKMFSGDPRSAMIATDAPMAPPNPAAWAGRANRCSSGRFERTM